MPRMHGHPFHSFVLPNNLPIRLGFGTSRFKRGAKNTRPLQMAPKGKNDLNSRLSFRTPLFRVEGSESGVWVWALHAPLLPNPHSPCSVFPVSVSPHLPLSSLSPFASSLLISITQDYPAIKTIRLRGSDTRCEPTAHPIPRRSGRSPRHRRPPCPTPRSPYGHCSSRPRDRGPDRSGGPGPGRR